MAFNPRGSLGTLTPLPLIPVPIMLLRSLALALLCSLAAVLHPSATFAGGDFDTELQKYKAGIQDKALVRRTAARARLATTRDVRALRVLAEDYAKHEEPIAQVRYLIAHIASRYFEEAEWVAPFQEWMDDATKPEDAWLWFLGRSVWAKHAPNEELGELPNPKLCVHLRAAALEAVAAQKRMDAVDLINNQLDALGKTKGLERGIILGSLGSIALSLKEHLKVGGVEATLIRLIDQIDHKLTPDWAALMLARRFAALLDMSEVTLQTPYLQSILEGKTGPKREDDDRYARPTFAGIKASGKRICYVIDCSDSMLTPLTGKEKEVLRKPAITGEEKRDKKKKGSLEDELDWKRIKTRFDLAREYLRLSLLGLTKDQSFAVVCFGTNAEILEGTKGMQPAKPRTVKKALKALRGLSIGPATETRIHGTLMGDTNFQAAFMTAFGVVSKGLVKGQEYVDPLGFTQGCDTIFFLSDGRPTADNWPGEGPMSGPGGYRDRESGKRIEPPAGGGGGTGTAIHVGPYADGGFYLDGEIQRMNLLRKAEIHCIGIGEAKKFQLKAIAKLGLGKVRMIGSQFDEDD